MIPGQEMIPAPLDDVIEEVTTSAQLAVFRAPPPDIIASTQPPPSSPSTSCLINHYNLVRQVIETPNDEHNAAVHFKNTLQNLLPSKSLMWYRNWFSKLENTTALKEIHFFIDVKSIAELISR